MHHEGEHTLQHDEGDSSPNRDDAQSTDDEDVSEAWEDRRVIEEDEEDETLSRAPDKPRGSPLGHYPLPSSLVPGTSEVDMPKLRARLILHPPRKRKGPGRPLRRFGKKRQALIDSGEITSEQLPPRWWPHGRGEVGQQPENSGEGSIVSFGKSMQTARTRARSASTPQIPASPFTTDLHDDATFPIIKESPYTALAAAVTHGGPLGNHAPPPVWNNMRRLRTSNATRTGGSHRAGRPRGRPRGSIGRSKVDAFLSYFDIPTDAEDGG